MQKPTIKELQNRITELENKLNKYQANNADQQDRNLIVESKNISANEKKLKVLYENTTLAYESLSEEGTILDVNPAWLKTLGYERSEVINQKLTSFLHPGQHERFNEQFEKLKRSGKIQQTKLKLRHKKGNYIYVSYEGCATYDENGAFKQTYCAFQNITKQYIAEKKLRESEELFRSLYNNIPGGVILIDKNYRIKDINQRACDITGFDRNEIIGQLCDCVCPKGSESKECPVWEKGNQSFEGMDTFIKCKDGSFNPILKNAKIVTVKDEDHILEVFQDTKQQKETEQKLRDARDNFNDIFESVADGIAYTTLGGKVLAINKAFTDMIGIDGEKIIGKNLVSLAKELISLKDTIKIVPQLQKMIAGKNIDPLRFNINSKTIEIKSSISFNKRRITGVAHDITESLKAEEAIKEKSKRANKQRKAITSLALFDSTEINNYEEILKNITSVAARAMNVDRVSIWKISDDQSEITCETQYESQSGKFKRQPFRIKTDYVQSYLKALKKKGGIFSSNIETEKQTSELLENYLKPNNINAILHAGIVVNGKLHGVLCIENTGTNRDWHSDEEAFATTLSSIVAQSVINQDRKKTGLQLRESEKKFRGIFEYAPDAFFISDLNGQIVDINRAAEKITGYKRSDLLWEKFTSFLPEDKHQRAAEILTENAEGKVLTQYEIKIFRKDRKKIYMEITTIPIKLKGETYVLGIGRDITVRKENELEVRKLYQAIEQNPVSIIITDKQGNIEYVNPIFTEISGFSKDEIIGKKPSIQKSGKHDENFYREIWKKVTNGDNWYGEILNKKKNGDLYWESVSISPIIQDNGETTHIIAVKENITEMKQINSDLKKAKEKAEQSDKLKSSFLANMSHEIRTPMNGIIGFAQMISKTNLSEEKRKFYAKIILDNGKQLLNLVNDILDISMIESDSITLNKTKLSIKDILDDLYTFYHPLAKNKNINLIYNKNAYDNESYITADKIRLNQIFNNLLNNALKFTESGSISIEYKINQNLAYFSIRDTGIGIEQDKLNYIFKRFRQESEETGEKYGGTGLGLSITQKLVELQGGTIWAESKKNKGATFYFTIPLA